MGDIGEKKAGDRGPHGRSFGELLKKKSPFLSFARSSGALSKAAGVIMEKARALSRLDLAFAAIVLGALAAAPAAEYLISASHAGEEAFFAGFGNRRQGAASVYEPGMHAFGGYPDGEGDIITPLGVRDPASLITGLPGVRAATAGGRRKRIRSAARGAMSEAVRSAGTPSVAPKMRTALRGISSALSAGKARTEERNLGGKGMIVSARKAPVKAAPRSMIGPVGGPEYKGTASRSNGADRGAFERLRGGAARASGNFSGASGISSLEKAARGSVSAPPARRGAGVGYGESPGRRPDSSVKDVKRTGGESLEQRAEKMRMQKALDWEFYKRYEIPKKVISVLIDHAAGTLAAVKKEKVTEIDVMMQGGGYFCHRDSPRDVIPFEFCNAKKLNCGGCKCGLNRDPENPPPGVCGAKAGGGTPASGPGFKTGGPPAAGSAHVPSAGTAGNMSPGPVLALGERSAVFRDYDQVLAQMYVCVLEGGRTQDLEERLRCALEIAGAFSNLRADLAAERIKAGADRTVRDAIAPFDEGIGLAESNAAGMRGAAEQAGPPAVCVQRMRAAEDGCAAAAAERLGYFREVSAFYKDQLERVKRSADRVAREYTGEVLPAAEAIRGELAPLLHKIEEGRPLLGGEEALIERDFERLCGGEFFAKALSWRGADAGYAGGEIAAYRSLNDETEAWNELDPCLRYAGGMRPLGNGEPARGDLLSALVRGYSDAAGQAGEIYVSAKRLIDGGGTNAANLGVTMDFQPLANLYAECAALRPEGGE